MNSRKTFVVVGCAALVAALWFVSIRLSTAEIQNPLPQFSSYFMRPTFVDDAFTAVGNINSRPEVSMVLVNHHLLASQFIARVMATVATSEPVTVVLISPDHFSRGVAPISSVIAEWPTPYGILQPATETISALASAGVVHVQREPFAQEHGITNITMFVYKVIPAARFVPVIIRDDATKSAIDALAAAIAAIPGRVLIVGSFDFTHDATNAVARANDERSLGILNRGEIAHAEDIIVDSKPGIRLMMSIAQLRRLRFSLLSMTNSAQVLQQPQRTDVTSYITGTWAP